SAKGPKGMLFDLPAVIERARADADPRIDYVAGDFFRDPIPACKAYLLMSVLHHWSDDEAVAILENLGAHAPARAKLLLVEGVVGEGGGQNFIVDLDIEMLVMTTGRERTRADWERVLGRAGFRLNRIIPTHGPSAVIEGVRAA
ncbi:MAG TPA: methyltransferase, partial [Gammaproteobacteria bacterium]|nr:methyltransferase [Gammaproteobacteria bacterium]